MFFMPEDVFKTSVGRFWGIPDTRGYMRARFAAADALLRANTIVAVEKALGHFTDMLRLCRSDNLGVRDIIPSLMLRLGREQECYNFLKWWATIDNKDHHDWDDVTLPHLDIRRANAFEPVDIFCSGNSSLSHLVILTLLKLRMRLDLDAFEASEFESGLGEPPTRLDRPIGGIVRAKMRTLGMLDISTTVDALEGQYRRLCRVVNDANPYFWEALVDEAEETPTPPPHYTCGSIEEANLTLYQCKDAWQETEDAILMIDSETTQFIRMYEGQAAVAGAGDAQSKDPEKRAKNAEIRRATGDVFPSRFEPPLPTSSPAELFPSTRMSRSQIVRFICRNDRRKVLVYADGACANNGQPEPRAGWAVVCGPSDRGEESNSCVVSGRLENKGPFGDDSVATSNRAELRAAIAVLRLCDWRDQGFDSVVIATDSSYVVDGATSWVRGWMRNGWKTRTGSDVKNRDLWNLLLAEVERWEEHGLCVELWKIPRELNGDADRAAKQAAYEGAAEVEFGDIVIGPPQTEAAKTESGPSQTKTAKTKPSPSQTKTAKTKPGLPQNKAARTDPVTRILALCLEHGPLFDSVFGGLVSQITSKAKLERATTQEAALSMLSQEPPPSVILVADAALTRQKKVWERVIDRLREGATVVLAGCFSSMVNMGEFNRFFARLGLPWERGSYHRTTVSLRSGVVGDDLVSRLPSAYSVKAVFVENVARSAAWYSSSETSNEAAVVFAEVGLGKLGYIGDVNGEKTSEVVVLAMCGLLD
jgi:ribonuclease HI